MRGDMEIIRFEYGSSGVGIYADRDMKPSHYYQIRSITSDHMGDAHPTVHADFDVFSRDYYSAFPSVEAAKEWFGEDLDNLLKLKFVKIKKINVKECILGKSGKQVIFLKADIIAEKIARRNIFYDL